jgi:hypothetical protein
MTTKTGWYSQAAAERYGSTFWVTPDGIEVEVSAVLDADGDGTYRWPDKREVGPVAAFSRLGRPAADNCWWHP